MRADTVRWFWKWNEVVDPTIRHVCKGAQMLINLPMSAKLGLFLGHYGKRRDGDDQRGIGEIHRWCKTR